MEYVLNEKSLKGQFANSDNFDTDGLKPLLGVIQTLSSFGVNDILKKTTFYSSEVSPGKKWHELMNGRMSDTVRAMVRICQECKASHFGIQHLFKI